jgi:hypothetical protein
MGSPFYLGRRYPEWLPREVAGVPALESQAAARPLQDIFSIRILNNSMIDSKFIVAHRLI